MRGWIGQILIGLCITTLSINAGHARELVASTQPLFLIAQAVTQGIEQPKLLIPAQQDGHHIQIRPEDRRLTQHADLIVWVGAEYEAALDQLLTAKPNAVALSHFSHIQRLPLRDLNGQPRPNSLDPHLWLSPYNAIFTAHLIANIRAQQYPKDAAAYQKNAAAFTEQLIKNASNTPKNPQAYWAYHDAYQYIEKYAAVRFIGALTTDPELPPTAQQLQRFQKNRTHSTPCLLAESHAPSALIQRLMPVKHVTIDETMRNSQNFIQGWTELRDQIHQCTEQPR